MKIIWREEQVKEVSIAQPVKDEISRVVHILDEEYGAKRKISDLGGYVVIVENEKDISSLEKKVIKGTIAEYSEEIGSTGYYKTLYLISDDYAVVTITEEKLI